MLKIVCGLLSRRESQIFREPVDWKGLGLTDYLQIVKDPRDLGSIKKKIEEQGYEKVEDIANDIRLVWSNCMLYNRDGSEYYHLANKFSKSFEETYQTFVRMSEQSDDPNRLPTAEERMALSHDIFKIDNTEMAAALTIIEEDSPTAIIRRPDDLMINFDALTAPCFHRLTKFVLSAMVDPNTKKNKKEKKRPLSTTTTAASKKNK